MSCHYSMLVTPRHTVADAVGAAAPRYERAADKDTASPSGDLRRRHIFAVALHAPALPR